jgi:hypothetical protein
VQQLAGVHNGTMTVAEFRRTSTDPAPPAGLAPELLALWHDAHGDWEAAHQVAQDIPDPTGAWIHAYLHRKEGDLSNARYWYQRAGKPESQKALDAEWEQIAQAMLAALR